MKTLRLIYIVVIAFSLLQFTSGCRKEKVADGPDYNVLKDHSLAESNFDDASSIMDEAAGGTMNYKSENTLLGACAQFTNDTISMPHTITVDFGTSNCLCGDGKYRRGSIMATYTGAYRDSGTVITITFNNYFVNNNQVLGTRTVTNEGTNINGNLWYSIHVSGSIVKANSGGTITWNSDRTREWIQGESTPALFDDVWLISGTANGVNANGTNFTVTITTPLRKEAGCSHFVSGIVVVTRSGKPDITVDYGNGTCDSDVIITINGVNYNYSLL